MLPDFNQGGSLPPGIHAATWREIEQKFGWNERRKKLLGGLKMALENLKQAGCKRDYLNGSFVTTKDQPGDFDACWEPGGVDLDKLDPILLDFSNRRARQKERYGGEFFPATADAKGDGTLFLEFIQSDRNGGRKGIVAVDLAKGFP